MSTKVQKWILTTVLAVGQMLAVMPTTQAQVIFNDRNTSTTSFLDTCSGEMVNLTIESHTVVRLVGTDPDGTRHLSIHVNFQGNGNGASSGARYRYNGNSQREQSIASGVCVGEGEVETYTRLISQGNSGNRYVRTAAQLVAQEILIGGVPTCVLVIAGPPTISVECHG